MDANDESVERGEAGVAETGTRDGVLGLGVPSWFLLVVLDALALLLIAVLLVANRKSDLEAYVAGTHWALQILAYCYVAVALFLLARAAVRRETPPVLVTGLFLLLAMALLGLHWVGMACVTLVVIAHLVLERGRSA